MIHPDAAGMTGMPLQDLERLTCRVRHSTLDNPLRFSGRDKRAPPNGHDRHAPPTWSSYHQQAWHTYLFLMSQKRADNV